MTDTERQPAAYPRSSGILAHITSLPSPYGIGDMGPGTYEFLRFLQQSKQSIWQILPLGPTESAFANSPYMTVSAFAGNPLIISPDLLFEDGFLTRHQFDNIQVFSPYSVDFLSVTGFKEKLLALSFSKFQQQKNSDFIEFVEQTEWLADYCLFKALKEKSAGKPWFSWARDLTQRKPQALEKAGKLLANEIRYYQFEQFIFTRQWQRLHDFAGQCGIQIFGDIPIYVSHDSADVWSHQDIFELDATTGLPMRVAGVPPDYFSETGQKWGNPLYRWHTENTSTYSRLMRWWISRFQHMFQQVDIARVDHFRGFESYWAVPQEHKTAIDGKWCKGPGKKFFDVLFKELGQLKIIAEDLGEITEEVVALRDKLQFPGMKILQFAFDDNPENEFLPCNYTSTNSFVYTGTHDNDTSVGWFLSDKIDDKIRKRIKNSANRDLHDHHGIHKDLIYLAMSSIANVCILPLQDILGFGSDCRMNTPGTETGNWVWRCSEEFLNEEVSGWLGEQAELFRRSPEEHKTSSVNVSAQDATIS